MRASAFEKAQTGYDSSVRQKAQAAGSRILELQKRVKPDTEGWTIRDYIDQGRR